MTEKSAVEKTSADLVLEKALSGDFSSIKSLLESIDKAAASSDVETRQVTSKAVRRAEWKTALDSIPMDKIIELQDKMNSYVDEFLLTRIEMVEPRELVQSEIDQLAREYKTWEFLNDFLQARHQQFRSMTFASLNQKYTKEIESAGLITETPPEQMPGELFSEVYGIRFKREGGGRKDPTINWGRLEAELAEDVWKSICDSVEVEEQIIEAHVEFRPNGEKLMDAINSGKIPLEVLREVLVPGAWNTPKFVPRKVK